jgi:hypothetical protein
MELIEIIFTYKGALLEAEIHPQENYQGLLYPVNIKGRYSFTICFNEENGWYVMQEDNGTIPEVETELFTMLLRHLRWELNHVM